MTLDPFTTSLLTALPLAAACALLSVLVVLRRWAFIGEGISHSGFGGAGTAWLLAVVWPAANVPWTPYAAVVVFSLLAALTIGWLTARSRVAPDSAIGIFLVASLAWGFVGQQAYVAHFGRQPFGFDNLLFGRLIDAISPHFAFAAAAVSVAVIIVVAMLFKEILAYCFDPVTAQASGVPTRMVHYLLVVLLAVVIVVAVRIAGTVLATALLVLPGATAMQLSRRLNTVLALSIVAGVAGAAAGLALSRQFPALSPGPAVVLTLFLMFVAALAVGSVRRA